MAGATESELRAVEAALGQALPAEHRAPLAEENGGSQWYGDVFLMIYGTDEMVTANQELERHPGLLVFGSDGSRELIGFDLREEPPPVVMIDITSAGWEEALYQAPSFTEFMRQRSAAEGLRWDEPYEPGS